MNGPKYKRIVICGIFFCSTMLSEFSLLSMLQRAREAFRGHSMQLIFTRACDGFLFIACCYWRCEQQSKSCSMLLFGEKNAFWGSNKPGYDYPQFNPHDQNWIRLLLNRQIKLWRNFNREKQNGCGR